ncbi:MAG: prenyltransferase, partial [Candidatus Eisenbacteria bacterium]|nr:prenyltransferase [Candidatus Eisenbacteria bacterium]
DHVSGADRASVRHTALSGGSGAIQSGALTARGVLAASLLCLACGAAVGLYLNAATRGNVVMLLGGLGVLLAWGYSERPIRLGYRGWGAGEATVGVAFGPLPVVGAYYVQTESVSLSALAASLPMALLVALVLLVNGFPDLESDSSVGKKTFVVTFGERRTIAGHHVLLALVYLTTGLLVVANVFPIWCMLSFATLPLALWGARVLRSAGDEYAALARAGAATVVLHALFGLLLVGGLLAARHA